MKRTVSSTSRNKSFTLVEIQKSACAGRNPHLVGAVIEKVKKSKYGNKKTVVDDIEFDSIKEAKRYSQLKILLKAGVIGLLELQVPYQLNDGGTHSLKYIADFVYIDAKSGATVVEDVKGHRTKEYKQKRRLMKKIYKIKIKEV